MLVICETHPVQYHAPVYQQLAELGVDFQVVYSSDFSVHGYRDREFQADFAWDTDLLSGYRSSFLKDTARGGASCYEEVTAAGLDAKLRTLQPSALLCLGYSAPFDKGVIRAARQLRVPLLMRSEASDSALQRNPLKAWARDWVLKRLYSRCAQLLFVGQNNRQHYQRLGVPESKLVFSPYCVSTTAFQLDGDARARLRQLTRESLGMPEDAICILFCGKLSRRKGVDLLLQSIKRLPESIRQRVHLLMVGEGQLREELTSQALADPQVQMTITGFQNQQALSPYYHAADLAVLPSTTSETWGLVVNEALHHGVPCLVSDRVGSAPDLIEPGVTGRVFRAGDVESMRRAIEDSLALVGSLAIAMQCQRKVAGYAVQQAAEGIRTANMKLKSA